MGMVTATGAILMITGWIALVEFDNLPESERKQIVQKIKRSPALILLISFMPVGICINWFGSLFGSFWMIALGASLIFLQGMIVSILFWKRTRWKSILLFIVIATLGVFIYIPFII